MEQDKEQKETFQELNLCLTDEGKFIVLFELVEREL